MGDFMDMNGGEGCVLILLDGNGIVKEEPSEGIYHAGQYMDRRDHVRVAGRDITPESPLSTSTLLGFPS